MALLYAEASPDQLNSAIRAEAPVIIPLGALEWHGPHLPLGLDGIVSEYFAELLAEKLSGVLLPTQWNAMTTLPHPTSLQVSTETFRRLIKETTEELTQMGFRTVCWVSGHYAQGQMVELYRFAEGICAAGQARVFVGTPLEPLGDSDLLDHAGKSEAAQLMAIRPDLVRTDALPPEITAKEYAVLGEHPASASPEEGNSWLVKGLDAWDEWVMNTDAKSLTSHYGKAVAGYQPYIDAYYRESWEQAIRDWWATK